MSEQEDGQTASTLQCPTTTHSRDWKAYWNQQGQTWRTRPEIDRKRQEYLAERRAIIPDIEQGIYPFKDIRLTRADVEWLLATHENGRGPVDWSDETQRERQGLDFRGVFLNGENLSSLPLARLQGGLSDEELRGVSFKRSKEFMDAAAIHLEAEGDDSLLFDYRFLSYPDNEGLCEIHLEGATLSGAFLTNTTLFGAYLTKANLQRAHLENADLRDTHLEEAVLDYAYLMNAHLANACLMKASLKDACMNGAWLPEANSEGADLYGATLNKAYLWRARLRGSRLYHASFKGANLKECDLTDATLTEASLEDANLVEARLEKADLTSAHLEGADLSKCHLEGAFCCQTFFNGATKLNNVILSDEKDGSVSLAEVNWGNVHLTVIDWSQLQAIGNETQARQRKSNGGEIKTTEQRLEEYRDAIRADRQLAVVLRSQGLDEDAARFAYHAQVLQMDVLWLEMVQQRVELRQRGRTLGAWLFSWFIFLLAGYGYKPLRSFIAYLIVIVAFAVVYFFIGRTVGPALSPLGSVVFSMTSFHGRGFFPGGIGLDDPLTVVAALEAFVGLLIEVTFIATLTQRLFGK